LNGCDLLFGHDCPVAWRLLPVRENTTPARRDCRGVLCNRW
jgi:hypothetical protein